MKKKLLIIGSCFIGLICLQVFSSGHKHVVVVDENVKLTRDVKALKTENKGLKSSVASLEAKNEELTDDKVEMAEMVSSVIGDLDSTKSVVKNIKKELQSEKDINVKQSTGEQFDFQPIKLPDSDSN